MGQHTCKQTYLKFKELMQNVSWDAIYTDGSDWYDNFINLVYTKIQQSFPLVRL